MDPELRTALDDILVEARKAAELRGTVEANSKALGEVKTDLRMVKDKIHAVEVEQVRANSGNLWVQRVVWLVVGGLVTGAFGLAAWALSHIASG